MKHKPNQKVDTEFKKKQNQYPLEILIAELGSNLTAIETIELKAIELSIERIKELTDTALELSMQVEERLGFFEKCTFR
jgi:hypothetical protein